MRVDRVNNNTKAVSIEIREDEGEFSGLTTVNVGVEHGSLNITVTTVDNKTVVLMTGGGPMKHPLDHYKMNSIESELESALKLFRELRKE